VAALRAIVVLEGRFDENSLARNDVLDVLQQAVKQGCLALTEELNLQLTYRLRLRVVEVLAGRLIVRELLVDGGDEVGITDQLARQRILLDDAIEVFVSEVEVEEVEGDRQARAELNRGKLTLSSVQKPLRSLSKSSKKYLIRICRFHTSALMTCSTSS